MKVQWVRVLKIKRTALTDRSLKLHADRLCCHISGTTDQHGKSEGEIRLEKGMNELERSLARHDFLVSR